MRTCMHVRDRAYTGNILLLTKNRQSVFFWSPFEGNVDLFNHSIV